jgi:hypothetical protein
VFIKMFLQEAELKDTADARALRSETDVVKAGLFKEITMYETRAFLAPKKQGGRRLGLRATNPKKHRIEVLFKVRALLGSYIMCGVPSTALCRLELKQRFAEFTSITTNYKQLWDEKSGPLGLYMQLYQVVMNIFYV